MFAVSEDGELQDINKFSGISAPDASGLTAELLFGAKFETAYRSGDYAAAIQLFQMAINLDGSYGQAYSNLGLVFQKSGRVAEAQWADALREYQAAQAEKSNPAYDNAVQRMRDRGAH